MTVLRCLVFIAALARAFGYDRYYEQAGGMMMKSLKHTKTDAPLEVSPFHVVNCTLQVRAPAEGGSLVGRKKKKGQRGGSCVA